MKQMNETCIKPRFYNFKKSIKFSSYYHNQIEFSSKANKSKTAIFVYIKAKKPYNYLIKYVHIKSISNFQVSTMKYKYEVYISNKDKS